MSIVEDIKDSCKKNLEERLSSPFYGTFAISWLLWNWKIWYVTFFVDSGLLLQEKSLLKLDYILSFYKLNFFSFGESIIFPLASSWLVVFVLPKITDWFYDRSLLNKNSMERIKNKRERELIIEQVKNLSAKEEFLKKKEAVDEIETDTKKLQEDTWKNDYLTFKSSKYYQLFEKLKESLYVYQGNVLWGWNNDLRKFMDGIPVHLKSYADSNDLISIEINQGNEKVKLTEKGKYFMKKYTEEVG